MNKSIPLTKRRFPVLERAIFENGISKMEIAEYLGLSYKVFLNRLNGITAFSLEEACKLQQRFFPQIDILDLFNQNLPA